MACAYLYYWFSVGEATFHLHHSISNFILQNQAYLQLHATAEGLPSPFPRALDPFFYHISVSPHMKKGEMELGLGQPLHAST
jgi:hypothetical protein